MQISIQRPIKFLIAENVEGVHAVRELLLCLATLLQVALQSFVCYRKLGLELRLLAWLT